MTTAERHLTRITMIAAVLAAAFTAQGARADERPARQDVRVVHLEPVVVTAKRVRVVQLERVVVVAKRLGPAATVLAQRGARAERG